MKKRTATVKRKTKETGISVKLCLDGSGENAIKTGIAFLDHMLSLFAFHGLFDLDIKVSEQDLDVDIHHTNEDVGISLGEAFRKALGAKSQIKRFGDAEVPMDEAVAKVVLDISGRGSFNFIPPKQAYSFVTDGEGYNLDDAKEFLKSFASNAGITLTCEISRGENLHHSLEAAFKAFGRALREACEIDPRKKGIPSTKGRL
ncbi:MAG: hypothetical protein AUJ75_04480 [Candidatus Omnitrophica bacterium CG1_02_49_10]|nr:MAG: hypothetical protein AUJ75_04480 [Candidatus Omnitrophica bacterium CG1_02_49_10]